MLRMWLVVCRLKLEEILYTLNHKVSTIFQTSSFHVIRKHAKPDHIFYGGLVCYIPIIAESVIMYSLVGTPIVMCC